MSRTADNSVSPGLGLYLDPIGACAGSSLDGRQSQCVAIAQSMIPPAALLPHLSGERIAADIACPPDIRGTGQIWPEEARIDPEKNNSARFPIAFAWKYVIAGEPVGWRWRTPEGMNRRCTAYEAIATVAHRAISELGCNGDQQVALIVPNSIDETIQENLLNELRLVCPSAPKLLWRPIAAALAWCEEYASYLLAEDPPLDESIGDLLCLHLGFDGFEHCVLKLIPRKHGDELFLLPARMLPQSGATLTPNIDVLDQLTKCVIGSDADQLGYRWWIQWCTDFLTHTFAQNETAAGRSSPPQSIAYPTNDDIENVLSSSKSMLQSHKRWLERLRSLDASNVRGVVATGHLASARMGSHTFAEKILLQSGIDSSSVELYVEGAHARVGELLPRGAAIDAQRAALRLPSYLDTIPTVETMVTRLGEPQWQNLIKSDTPYVPGGEEFVHRPRDLALAIQRQDRQLVLTVYREGHERVREVTRELAVPPEQHTPVELEVRMNPGQGNPRVEVIPTQHGAIGPKRVYIDWKRSRECEYGRQEALDREPRTNPPCERRLPSLACWQGFSEPWMGADWVCAQELVKDVIQLIKRQRWSVLQDKKGKLARLREALRQRDDDLVQNQYPPVHATAVSSDGTLHDHARDQGELRELEDGLVSIVADPNRSELHPNALRALGNIGSTHPQTVKRMKQALQALRLSREEIWLIGNAMRDPTDIAKFMQKALKHLQNDWSKSDTMRAVARICQYREDAAMKLDSEVATHISRRCLRYAREQVDQLNLQFIYRHASLSMVYLLRRRRYDDSYLPPDSEHAVDIKEMFQKVIQAIKSGRMGALAGFVDLRHVTQTMIDYINRRGRGRLGFFE